MQLSGSVSRVCPLMGAAPSVRMRKPNPTLWV